MDGHLQFDFTIEDLEKWKKDETILNELNTLFKRLNPKKRENILDFLIKDKLFKVSDVVGANSKVFIQYNQSKFEEDGTIKVNMFKEIRLHMINFINNIEQTRRNFNDLYDDGEHDNELQEQYFHIKNYVTFEDIRKQVCDTNGNVNFIYNFLNPDLQLTTPRNTNILQRVSLQILSPGIKFDYPLTFKYYCDCCENETLKKSYEVVSQSDRLKCQHFYTFVTSGGEQKTRVCGNTLSPDKNVSTYKDAYFYEIGYEDNKTKFAANAFSFREYKPGHYECVIYKVTSGKTETFFIVDVKKVPPNTFTLPEQKSKQNYLFTLQQEIDKYIKEKTGVGIYGLYPIKVGLIMQTMLYPLKERLILNTMIVGDPSTGKSLLLKYYSFMLNNYYNMSTNGLSVSIPGLRGTRNTINLFGKDVKIVTVGHLGTFRSIHIDEAGESPELVRNLKTFLLEDNYSYDKAGSTGISNERTSHVNVSQNLDYEHVGQYRGAIRKSYKDLNMTIGGTEKEDWNEEWDLFLPLHDYTNPHLRKIVREKRMEYKQKQVWWIDGLDYALHERFPFYFYIVNEKENPQLDKVIAENNSNKVISKNLEIIRVLFTETLDEYYKDLEQYEYCKEDVKAYKVVDKIIHDYGHTFDARMKTVYYNLVRLSRIFNKRTHYEEMDYDIVKWFLEKTNVKLDITNTADYNIVGPPNKEVEQKKTTIEEETKTLDESFGLPSSDFS